MGRIERSFRLMGQSYRVLVQDKELMVLPLMSGIVMVAVMASFFWGFGFDERAMRAHRVEAILPMFLLYVVTYAVGLFFQAAVVAGATERLRGGDPTVGSALAAASRRIGAILAWAVVAATVGVVLRSIQNRAGFIGKIVVGLIGAAWSLATFFIVPVLVLEDRSIVESFRRSLRTFQDTWGESVVGSVSLGMAATCAWVTLIAIVGLFVWAGMGFPVIVLGIAAGVLLAIFFSALQGVFVASLYRYATEGHQASGLDADLLSGAFTPKD
jgi:uncharacterized protein DUF6159